MSTPQSHSELKDILARAGWYPDTEWAKAFDEEVKTFRDKVRKKGIPRSEWGLVNVADVLDFLNSSKEKSDGKEAKQAKE